MSYVVHLWQQPVPTTLAQAEVLLEELRRSPAGQPDAAPGDLLAAIDAGLPPGGETQDWWNEVPDVLRRGGVLSLAPAVAEFGTVMPAILSAARRLGWVLLDPQAGELHLPSGQVLSRSGSRTEPAPVVPLPADMDDSRTARKAWLHQCLAPLFVQRGWRTTRGEFCFGKKFPWGQARVLSNMHCHEELSHGVWLGLKLPAPLQSQIDDDGDPHLMLSLDAMARRRGLAFTHVGEPGGSKDHVGYPVYKLPFAGADHARRCRDELVALYDTVVLDWIESLTSLERLEHWVNRVSDDDHPFLVLRELGHDRLLWHYHPDLLLAAAVRAPDLEARARARLALYEADPVGCRLLPRLRELLAVCGLAL